MNIFKNILGKRSSDITKKTRATKKQKGPNEKNENVLRESILPNKQQQDEILAFERERNEILKERLSLRKELLEFEEN